MTPRVYSAITYQLFSPADRPHVLIRPSQNRGPGTTLVSPICRYFPSLGSHDPLPKASIERALSLSELKPWGLAVLWDSECLRFWKGRFCIPCGIAIYSVDIYLSSVWLEKYPVIRDLHVSAGNTGLDP